MDEVTIVGKIGSSRKPADLNTDFSNMPAYIFNDRNGWTSSYKGDLSTYNNEFGTNFTNNEGNGTAWAQWNYQFHYKPEYDDMISSIHSATNQAADILLDELLMVLPLPKLGLLTKGYQYVRGLKPMYLGLTKTKGGFTKFQLGFRNPKTGYQFKLDRHGFNTNAGNSIYTTHINSGIHGKKHYFLNVFKRNKTSDYTKEYIFKLSKFKF